MDNKLSKPAAWLAIYHGEVYDEAISITRSVVEAQAERFGWESALTEIIPIYSQEYVSALTQRIAELESANKSQDDHINQQQDRIESLEKKNGDLGRSLGAAEKLLATPVRLPKTNGYWDEQEKAVEDAITLAKHTVRLAGFTVERDE